MKIMRVRFVGSVELGNQAVPERHIDDNTRIDGGRVSASFVKGANYILVEVEKSNIVHVIPLAQVSSLVIKKDEEKNLGNS